jgi:periplasmic copper chaperone A
MSTLISRALLLALASIVTYSAAQNHSSHNPAQGHGPCTSHVHSTATVNSQEKLPLIATEATIFAVPLGIADTSAVMRLKNTGDKPIVITSVTSPIACPCHTMLMGTRKENGLMGMYMVDSLTIPAHGELLLKPDGYHIMIRLKNSKTALVPDAPIALRLHTKTGQSLLVKATVVFPG